MERVLIHVGYNFAPIDKCVTYTQTTLNISDMPTNQTKKEKNTKIVRVTSMLEAFEQIVELAEGSKLSANFDSRNQNCYVHYLIFKKRLFGCTKQNSNSTVKEKFGNGQTVRTEKMYRPIRRVVRIKTGK